jgi:micrococcal nuclease
MRRLRNNVIPYSRDYRRAKRFGIGLPPQKPHRWWHRVIDPLFYLRALIVVSMMALLVIPLVTDGALALARPINSGTDQCRVLHVVDGDTADIWCAATGFERARLVGFDAPELFSPKCASEFIAAQQAKWALRAALFGNADLRLQRGKLDHYDRRLVTIWVGPDLLAKQMIADGLVRGYDGGLRQGWCG